MVNALLVSLYVGRNILFFILMLSLTSVWMARAQENVTPIHTELLTLQARISENGPLIDKGITWRIYTPKITANGKLKALAVFKGGTKSFKISPGEYIVHAAYGYASAVKRISVRAQGRNFESLILDAGGLQLEAVTTRNSKILPKFLRFFIYSASLNERGERSLIAHNLMSGDINILKSGTYHIVSRYGKMNAVIRADIRVRVGKITAATLQHHAARVTLKLVRKKGADSIANTAWSVLTSNGEIIGESMSTLPRMILTEGNYTAIAKNGKMTYSKDFNVKSGVNRDIEVIANPV